MSTKNLNQLKAGDVVTVYDNFNGEANQVYASYNVDRVTANYIICLGNSGEAYKFNKKNQGRVVGYAWPQYCLTLES